MTLQLEAEQSRLRVMYVVPDLRIGGAERHVSTLMPALDPGRFEPAVVCIGDRGALFDTIEAAGIPAVALGRSKRQAVAALWGLILELRRFAPDVVITRGYNAEMLGRLAALIAGVPASVVWVHNCGDTEPRGRFRFAVDKLLDRMTTAYFGVAVNQIPYLVDELGHPRSKVTIIHNGVDPSRFDTHKDRSAISDAGIEGHHRVAAIVAAMRPEKDHALFLTAAAKVVQSMPNARFVLVGDGPMRAALEQQATDLGIEHAVLFTGPRSDVPAVLQAIDVIVLCSYTIECFPMAVLEAMAAGRPAVCTDVGGVSEMIVEGETGYLVPPHDSKALADRLMVLLGDPDLRHRMGAAARRRVENEFSLDDSITATERALVKVVGNATPSTKEGVPLVLTVVLDLTFVGGVEVLLLNLFRAFDPAVVKPRILCLRDLGPLADDFRASGFEVALAAGHVGDEGSPLSNRFARYRPRRIAEVIRDLRRSQTDVVMVPHHHRAALLLGRIAARTIGIPNVVAAHDMDLASVGGRVLPRWAVSTLWISDALVLLTPAQGDYLHRDEGVGRSPASTIREVVIHNGIVVGDLPRPSDRAPARERLGVGTDEIVIGIVARLSRQKAHEVLFGAVARLRDAHPRLRLVVVGDGDRASELRSVAADLGIAAITTFTGVRDDVREILPAFDISCLSSVHEGVPIVVIESMAAGVPVVATACGSLRDIIADGEQGYLVPVGDVEALADRLGRLIDDADLRHRLGAQGHARAVSEFDIASTAGRYQSLLRELAQRKAFRQ